MKINEILTESIVDEAKMSPEVKKHMVKQGYKFLGHGQDQDAYLAPDGTILKIFGYEEHSKGYSFGQRSFIDFANFCKANPNNPFLPQFGGWEPFVLGNQQYIQIKCERLFDFEKSKLGLVADQLENLVDDIERWGAVKGLKNFLLSNVDDEYTDAGYRNATGKLVTLMGGEKQLEIFAQTVEQLVKLARQKRYRVDLHSGNFMLGSDGEIVINDPFFTGTWR